METLAQCCCKAVSLRISGEPEMNSICHCDNCRRRTGSAFGISVYFAQSDIVEISGKTRVYGFIHPQQDHTQKRHFCTECGTTLYWTVSTLPDLIGVAGGCITQPGLITPNASINHGKKVKWISLPKDWVCQDPM